MKKIWIDGYEANVPQRLGSGQIAFETVKQLSKDKNNDYTILIPSPPLDDMPKPTENFRYRVLKPNKLWTRIAIPFALYTAKEKPDLVFSPTHYIPRFSPVKRVVTIFDLAYLHFPQMFKKKDLWQLTSWTKFSIEHADHIVTISNSSKQDIIREYKTPKDRITVAYPGYDRAVFRNVEDKSVLNKYGIEGDYIIYIGTLQPRKNLVRLIDAVQRIGVKLVIVGKTTGPGRQAWMFEEILRRPKELGIEDKVIFTGFVPTPELPYLLSGSKAFVLPSLWEGFGIPAVEAMACGVPVIVSNVSSLPEVVGKAGLLVEPNSTDQIEQAVRTLLTDKKVWSNCVKKGFEQAKKFSWEKMGKAVIKVFEDV